MRKTIIPLLPSNIDNGLRNFLSAVQQILQENDNNFTAVESEKVPTTRSILTNAPLTGGGLLSTNRTLSISEATISTAGSMSALDKAKLDGLHQITVSTIAPESPAVGDVWVDIS